MTYLVVLDGVVGNLKEGVHRDGQEKRRDVVELGLCECVCVCVCVCKYVYEASDTMDGKELYA